MLKIGKNKAQYFLTKIIAVSFLAFFALAGSALAADEIDVEYPVGTNINGNNIFDEDNIYPGWEISKTIRIENKHATESANLYFTFDVDGDTKLAEMLNLYVIRVRNGSYRIGGAGDRWTLEEADGENLYVDELSAGEDERYEIKIKFNINAGNEYQNLETDFDIDFNITSETAGGPEPLRAGFTGQAPPEEMAGEETSVEEKIAGEEISGVERAATQCSQWPLWVWILLLVIYTVLFNYSSFRQGLENKIHWFFPAFWTAIIFALWYFFEKCQLYPWYPYAIVIIALVSYFSYLYWFREKRLEPDFKDKEEL